MTCDIVDLTEVAFGAVWAISRAIEIPCQYTSNHACLTVSVHVGPERW